MSERSGVRISADQTGIVAVAKIGDLFVVALRTRKNPRRKTAKDLVEQPDTAAITLDVEKFKFKKTSVRSYAHAERADCRCIRPVSEGYG